MKNTCMADAQLQGCTFCGCQKRLLSRCANCGAPALSITTVKSTPYPAALKPPANNKHLYVLVAALITTAILQIFIQSGWLTPEFARSTSQFSPTTTFKSNSIIQQTSGDHRYSVADIQYELSSITAGYNIYYAGISVAQSKNSPVVVNIEKTNTAIVLMLNSLRPVHWHISNPASVKVEAIIYSTGTRANNTGQSILSGDLFHARLLPAKKPLANYYQAKLCNCTRPGIFQCTGNSIAALTKSLQQLGNGRLTGLAVATNPSSLTFSPATTKQLIRQQIQHIQSYEGRKRRCNRSHRQSSPFFTGHPG